MTGGFYLLLREAQQWLAGTHVRALLAEDREAVALISTVSTPTWMSDLGTVVADDADGVIAGA